MRRRDEPRGIGMDVEAPREKANSLTSLAAAFAVTAGAAVAACSALETDGVAVATVCGIAAVTLERLCPRKAFWWMNIVLLGLLAAAAFCFADSFRALANRAFETSEKYQMYVYTRFDATASPTAALAVISTAVGSLCGLAAVRRLRSIYAAVFLLFVGAAVYFGVFPTAAATMAFCLSVLAAMAMRNGRPTAVVAILLAAAIGLALFPGESTAMHEFTEDIRDRFGEQLKIPSENAERSDPPDLSFVLRLPDNFGDMSDLRAQRGENFSGSTLGAARSQKVRVWMVAVVAALIIAAVAFPIARAYLGERRKRKLFRSEDIAAAVDAMFRASLGWLAAAGLELCGGLPAEYADAVASLVDEGYREEYVSAAALRDEALYSEHALDESHRERMRLFMERTELELRRRVGIGRRAAMRLGLSGGAK